MTPAGAVTAKDDARASDGAFEIELSAGVLTVSFDEEVLRTEARDVGNGYVVALAIQRRRALAWDPAFRKEMPGGPVAIEGADHATVSFATSIEKWVARADGTVELVREPSIDTFATHEDCVRRNEDLRETREALAEYLGEPKHEHLQRAHDRLRNEVALRRTLKSQSDMDAALARLMSEPREWLSDNRPESESPPACAAVQAGNPPSRMPSATADFAPSTTRQSLHGVPRP